MLLTAAKFLPFHVPLVEEDDIRAVIEVLKSGWITTGPRAKQFEESFAHYVGATYALAVNSGTAALHLALAVVGVGAGDEVIVPTMTFAATGEVVLYCNARPVLVDCDPETFNVDSMQIERAITSKTKAIVPVHFGGQPCDMDRILEIARRHNLKVIEDAAHALPARYKGRMVGTFGDITCFSFYATKTITTGEGGMVTTENEEYGDRMRIKSLHGVSKDAWNRYAPSGSWRYQILECGFKYNLTDIQAALGLAQLSKCEEMWVRRAHLAARYDQGLLELDAFQTPQVRPDVQHAWHLYVVRINPEVLRIDRDEVIEELRKRGIGTAVHFIPLHMHPLYQRQFGYQAGQFPVAEKYFDRCISLPIYPAMMDDDSDRVMESLKDIASQFRR